MPAAQKEKGAPENKMGTMPINKLLVSMSLPVMASMLIQALYNIVDSIFVAQISEAALTAVSLAFPVQILVIAVGVGTSVGINSLLSRALGGKNFRAANQAAANGILLIWLSCIPFVLLGLFFAGPFFRSQTADPEIIGYGSEYLFIVSVFSFAVFHQIIFEGMLNATGKTFYSMLSQSAGALANIMLDPIMIFGLFGFPALGVGGAAAATIIGQTVGAALAIYFNLRKNREITLPFKKFRPDGATLKEIYAVGAPSILLISSGSLMTYGLNLILIPFTSTAAAVLGVCFRLQSFVFMPVFGLTGALSPIVAYNFGARRKGRVIQAVRLGVLYASAIMLPGAACFQLFPAALLGLFNAAGEMLAIGGVALRIISLHFLLAGFCIVSISVFQALGDGLKSLGISVIRQFFALLPAAWLLSLTGSLELVWWAFPIAECVALAVSAVFLNQVYERKIKTLP
ncbi:MAG: MATE family efflux transporter [Acidaminococcales bacterium]|jgi:putative MATE family efflux protein|nr:MATE family efflux transporter [Acidaminococcales bacterium]